MLSGPIELDLCSLPEAEAEYANFDSRTGNYEFFSQDMDQYPPGVYTFEITGSIANDLTDNIVFEMVLVDPCPTATISLMQDNVFDEMTYTLRSPPEF